MFDWPVALLLEGVGGIGPVVFGGILRHGNRETVLSSAFAFCEIRALGGSGSCVVGIFFTLKSQHKCLVLLDRRKVEIRSSVYTYFS